MYGWADFVCHRVKPINKRVHRKCMLVNLLAKLVDKKSARKYKVEPLNSRDKERERRKDRSDVSRRIGESSRWVFWCPDLRANTPNTFGFDAHNWWSAHSRTKNTLCRCISAKLSLSQSRCGAHAKRTHKVCSRRCVRVGNTIICWVVLVVVVSVAVAVAYLHNCKPHIVTRFEHVMINMRTHFYRMQLKKKYCRYSVFFKYAIVLRTCWCTENAQRVHWHCTLTNTLSHTHNVLEAVSADYTRQYTVQYIALALWPHRYYRVEISFFCLQPVESAEYFSLSVWNGCALQWIIVSVFVPLALTIFQCYQERVSARICAFIIQTYN